MQYLVQLVLKEHFQIKELKDALNAKLVLVLQNLQVHVIFALQELLVQKGPQDVQYVLQVHIH